MPLGKIIRDAGENGEHFYFPTTATVTIVYGMNNGNIAQAAMIGNEGVVGISQFMGGETVPFQDGISAGHGHRIKTQQLKDEFNRAGPMLHLMLRYTLAFVSQLTPPILTLTMIEDSREISLHPSVTQN